MTRLSEHIAILIYIANHGHPQAWARGVTCPLWKSCKVFSALVVTAKRSVDELLLFMRYFYNLSSTSGDKAPRSPGEGLSSPGKNPVGAYAAKSAFIRIKTTVSSSLARTP